MSRKEYESAERKNDSDSFLANVKRKLPKFIFWGVIGAVILAAI